MFERERRFNFKAFGVNFEFTDPVWLWLLPPALAWVVWLAWTSQVTSSPARRWISGAIRAIVVIAVVFALAGLRWMHRLDGMNVLFLLDVSDSVPAEQQTLAREQMREFILQKPANDRAGVIVFGAESGLESSPSTTPDVGRASAVVPTERTDLAGALRLAVAALPEYGQRRLVLFSDGNENAGDALGAAASARSQGAAIDVVPLGRSTGEDIALERLQLPPRVNEDITFEAKALIQASTSGPATIQLFRNDQLLGEQKVDLDAGHNLFTFPQTISEAGFYSFDVRVIAARDQTPQNNRGAGFVIVRGQPRVLVLSDDPAADAPLVAALRSPEVEVQLISPRAFPDSLAELQSYDAIIACNVSALDLTRDQQLQLQSAVRDFGVGFICVGGDQTYAAGAYKGTPLDEILPVESDVSSRKVLPSGGLMLVIDRSGSMTGDKLKMASESAIAAAALLTRHDYVGVLAFDDQTTEIVPMQRVSDPSAIASAIASIENGGGTSMYPALRHAHEQLKSVPAALKHIVVLTDGMSIPGDFEGVVQTMANDRISVSTVGLGTDCDVPLLQRLAALGNGRFFHVPWPSQLPQIFIQETAVILKTAINEQPFVPQVAANTELIRGLGGSFPELLGHVVTMPRPRAETPLVTGQGDPLLAHWQYGLGRAVAFTSDARSKWARLWLGWDRYQQFWQQLLQWSLRRVESADLNAQVSLAQGQGQLVVEALDGEGEFRNFLNLKAAVVDPTGQPRETSLAQTGPGRYEGKFPTSLAGTYLIHLQEMANGNPVASQVIGASLSYSPEYAAREPNLHLLRRIAETTGGKQLIPGRAGSNPFFDDRRPSFQPRDLWERLLQFAIVLMVIDVGVRRIQLDREDWGRWASAGAALVGRRRRSAASSSADSTLADLIAARRSGRRSEPGEAPSNHGEREPWFTPTKAQAPLESRPDHGETLHPSPSHPPEPREASPQNRLLEAKRRALRKGRASDSRD